MVRVRLSVHYRVHSRQMLCIGGSQIPFGWSFLSIAKVPMAWNQGDIWTAEVRACWVLSCLQTMFALRRKGHKPKASVSGRRLLYCWTVLVREGMTNLSSTWARKERILRGTVQQ